MTDHPSNTSSGSFNQVPLRTVLGVVTIACIFLAITRPSTAASIMVIVAILLAIASIFLRHIRGEIVVLLIFGVPLVILAIGYALGVLADSPFNHGR